MRPASPATGTSSVSPAARGTVSRHRRPVRSGVSKRRAASPTTLAARWRISACGWPPPAHVAHAAASRLSADAAHPEPFIAALRRTLGEVKSP